MNDRGQVQNIAAKICFLLEERSEISIYETIPCLSKAKVPFLNAVGRAVGKTLVEHNRPIATLLPLWEETHREVRLIAISALGVYAKRFPAVTRDFLTSIVEQTDNWEVCDQLALRVVVHLLILEPEQTWRLLKVWAQAESVWLRRLAVVTIPPFIRARPDEAQRCLDFIGRWCMEETSRDVKKAVGWALREVSKKDPETVFGFLLRWVETSNSHTRWIIREGMRKLSKQQQDILIAKMRS